MTFKDELRKEALRAIEDVELSSKSHFVASEKWKKINLWLGIPSIILSVLAGSLALSQILPYIEIIAGIAGFGTGALVAILTFLQPYSKYEMHMNFGNKYLSLKGDLRRYKELIIDFEEDKNKMNSLLEELISRKKIIDSSALLIPNYAYEEARKRIENEETQYKVDKNNKK